MGMLNSYLGYVMIVFMLVVWVMIREMTPSAFRRVLKSGLILLVAFIVMMQGLVVSEMYAEVPEDVSIDYLIVLGAGLKGDQVSYTLAYRLDAAIAYLLAHPESRVIVSGGQGPDEWLSEGEAMSTYLLAHGINEQRIVIEDQSTSTEENIKFSLNLVGKDHSFAVVTSNYHMYRAKYIASPFLTQVEGISAHSPYWSVVNYMVRESATIANEWRKDVFND